MKFRNWKRGGAPQTGSEAAPAAVTDPNARPDMQVQEQPKPPVQDQASVATSAAAGPANSNAETIAPQSTNPAITNPSAANSQKSAGQIASISPKPTTAGSAAIDTSPTPKPPTANSAASQESAGATGEQPKSAPAATDNPEAPKSLVPGADEMAKAKNASDSAAEAAWLWKATAKGNPFAPVQLADMYVKGDGVPRSCEQAMVLLKTAAEKENARARNRLAAMYETGICVQRNRVEAYRWLSSALAASPSSQWAQQNRDLLWQQMTPEERTAAGKYR